MTDMLWPDDGEGTQAPAIFVGRGQELREIAAFLANNQSVSLIGLPGMGKSTLLRRLAQLLAASQQDAGLVRADILYAYVDCMRLRDSPPVEVFGGLAAALITALEANVSLPELTLAAAIAQPGRLTFEAAVRRLNGRGMQVVLAFDRFEQLSANPHLGVAFFNALRSAAARFRLAFLTASEYPLVELTAGEWARDLLSSPFFNIFAPVFLGPLEEDDARRLIHELLYAAPIETAETISMTGDALYALAGGSPLALRIAIRHTIETPWDHEGIARRTMLELSGYYTAVWRTLTPAEQTMLRGLNEPADGRRQSAAAMPEKTWPASAGFQLSWATDSGAVRRARTDPSARAVLHALVRKGLLVTDGASFRYPAQAWARFVAALPSL